jgi:antitoxin HigA-1
MTSPVTLVHPGKILKEELKSRNLNIHSLAIKIQVAPSRLYEIVNGKRSVSPETALLLGRYFGTDPQFWTNLQTNYDLAIAKDRFGTVIRRQVEEIK